MLARELAKFGTIGLLAFILDTSLYNYFVFGLPGAEAAGPLHDIPLRAKILATAIATVFSWLGNRYWAFAAGRREERTRELQAEKDRFSDPGYIKEQARIRLGLVEEGETPFRIIDPALGPVTGDDPVGEEPLPTKSWYEQLWDSVSLPPEEEKPANPARDEATRPDRLPTVPEQAPEPAPEAG